MNPEGDGVKLEAMKIEAFYGIFMIYGVGTF